jgi:adenine-specific DNA-methyltransferase
MAKRMPKKDRPVKTPIESIRHKDKRKNIPTEELRDFVAVDENVPKTIARSAIGLEGQG